MSLTHVEIPIGGQYVKLQGRLVDGKFYPFVEARIDPTSFLYTGKLIGEVQTFTIASGADGSAVTPIDLGGNFESVVLLCEDCSHIAAVTSVTAEVGMTGSDTLCSLYAKDDPSTLWSVGPLPTSDTMMTMLTYPFGIRRIRPILSNNADGGSVVFKAYGIGLMRSPSYWSALTSEYDDIVLNWEDMH